MAQIPAPLITGVGIIASKMLTKVVVEEVTRTWSERLFSWPWRPLKKVKQVQREEPSDQVFYANGKYYAHPALIEKIMRLTEKEKSCPTTS